MKGRLKKKKKGPYLLLRSVAKVTDNDQIKDDTGSQLLHFYIAGEASLPYLLHKNL